MLTFVGKLDSSSLACLGCGGARVSQFGSVQFGSVQFFFC